LTVDKPLSYKARRLFIRVNVSVTDGVLNWRYVTFGSEWRQSVPLNKMVPHPMITQDRGKQRQYLTGVFVLPLVTFGVLYSYELALPFVILIPVVMFMVLAYRYAHWLWGPMEWAVFDTELKDKTISVFRGGMDCGFDEFVAELDHAICQARQPPPKNPPTQSAG
jgi:hypothetical protein